MSLNVERQPIDLSTLPENLHKHLDPAAPEPLKMMAARGMLPVAPEQNVAMLYALAIAGNERVAAEANQSFADLPPDIVTNVLRSATHPGILDWAAEQRRRDSKVLEAIVTNRAADDNTVARVAKTADANLCDVIATNQIRILQAPAILEQMYQNANARMATVDRLLELAQREGVKLAGLPGLQAILDSGQDVFGRDEEHDPEVEKLLSAEAKRADEEAKKFEKLDEMSRSERQKLEEEEEEEQHSSGMLSEKIMRMSISEKIRFATLGSREALNILVRDPNKLVHMAAVRSPRVQPIDIRRWTRNKTLPDGVIGYICNQRDHTRHYEVMLNLCQNPKTPLADALKFLNHIRTNDLKSLAKDRNIPTQLSRQAKNLYKKRTGGRHG